MSSCTDMVEHTKAFDYCTHLWTTGGESNWSYSGGLEPELWWLYVLSSAPLGSLGCLHPKVELSTFNGSALKGWPHTKGLDGLDPMFECPTFKGLLSSHQWLSCIQRVTVLLPMVYNCQPPKGWPHTKSLVGLHPKSGSSTFNGLLSSPQRLASHQRLGWPTSKE